MMSKSKRYELRMLRQIVRIEFAGKKCRFCHELLIEPGWIKYGEGDGAPIKAKVTYHHKNGNHDDNRPENKQWVHAACHKSYHMRQAWRNGGLRLQYKNKKKGA